MKKHLIVALGLLVLPGLSMAAYNDLTLETAAIIQVGTKDLNISGTSAVIEDITVNPTYFVARLLPGSSIKVSSADKYKMTHDARPGYVTEVCNSTTSSLEFTIPAADPVSYVLIEVVPTSTVCGAVGGGGPLVISSPAPVISSGGGTYIPAKPKTVAKVEEKPVVPAATVAKPSAQAVAVSPVFSKGMSLGLSGEDVKRLQQLLNSDKDTLIASSGAGSPGKETTYFGKATQKAVMAFQKKNNVAKEGDAGYGQVGPKTRAKLLEVFGSGTVKPAEVKPVSPPQPVPKSATVQSAEDKAKAAELMKQVQLLQDLLAKYKAAKK
ncbi:MAG: peptidoglycan-binding domain-containing protein [Candidatus Paceibacterota bacterium]|jgi:hypothetical protein